MKKIPLPLVLLILLLPQASFAQSTPQAPASWIAFQREEAEKRAAFDAQMKSDLASFLSFHPEVQAYFEQMRASAKERQAQWIAAHQK